MGSWVHVTYQWHYQHALCMLSGKFYSHALFGNVPRWPTCPRAGTCVECDIVTHWSKCTADNVVCFAQINVLTVRRSVLWQTVGSVSLLFHSSHLLVLWHIHTQRHRSGTLLHTNMLSLWTLMLTLVTSSLRSAHCRCTVHNSHVGTDAQLTQERTLPLYST